MLNSYSNKQYLQNLSKKEQLEMMGVDFFKNKELNVQKIEKGYILPTIKCLDKTSWRVGGVLDQSKNYIEISGQYAYGEKTRVFGKYNFGKEDVEYIDCDVIYLNNFIDQWGHFLLDVIGRLWYAIENPNIKIAYTSYLNEDRKLRGNFLQLINLLGIDEDRLIYLNTIKQFKTVFVPETSILTAKYFTSEYSKLIDAIVENALKGYQLNSQRKIYCSRRNFKNKRTVDFGEDSIENIFSKNGYEIVFMEELSLIEQIRLLNECKEVVCLSGTLVHNAMFIKNNDCKFTVLNKTYNVNLNVYLTSQISKANFTFVDSYIAPLPISMGKGPYLVAITKQLKEYCEDRNISIYNIGKIDSSLIMKYYYTYLLKYKNKILKREPIGNNKNSIYKFESSTIRENYKEELKTLRGK